MPVCGHCNHFKNPNYVLKETNYRRTRVCKKGLDVQPLSDGCRDHSEKLARVLNQAVTNNEDMEEVSKKLSKGKTKLVKRKKVKIEQVRLI